MRRLGLSALAVLLWSGSAAAELTDAEKAQIRGFVQEATLSKAGRIRSLVARPDLDAGEAAEPLVAGYQRAPFDDAREALTSAILFGPGSAASRSALVVPVVRGLLARATTAMGELPPSRSAAWSDQTEQKGLEIVRIHRFVAERIANAGRPPPDGHDPSTGIRDDALKGAAHAYREHVDAHGKWLRHGSAAEGVLARVRAQAQITTIDLSRGLVPRHQVSGWLGLQGSRRAFFERQGILLEDGGSAPEERLAATVRLIESVPGATRGLSLWWVNKSSTRGLAARGVAVSRTPLTARPPRVDGGRFWPEAVEPSSSDAQLSEVAYTVAWNAVRVAFGKSSALSQRAAALAQRAQRGGSNAYLARDFALSALAPAATETAGVVGASPTMNAAHAVRMLLIDAPRAIELALVRLAEGRREPIDQVALGLGVLSTLSPDPEQIRVGRTGGNGAVEQVPIKVELRDGLVSAFTLDGHDFQLERAADRSVTKVLMDGGEPKVSRLSSARLRATAADSWTFQGHELRRLSGKPKALVIDDGRFRMTAPDASGGFDAVELGAAATNMEVRARLQAKGAGGGLLARASLGESSYRGVVVIVSAVPARAQLLFVDGRGKAFELAKPTALPPASGQGYDVRLSIKGDRVNARVDKVRLDGKLPETLEAGRVGLTVRPDGEVDMASISGSTLGAGREGKKK